jgi:O-antigen/teichoic acid export membrane protein
MVWKVCRPTLEVKPKSWLRLVRLAVPFALAAFFFSLYFNIDMIMLSYMKGDEVVGWYAVAYRFISVLLIFPGAFMGALWPIFSRLHIHAKDKFIFAHEKSVKYLLILALPIAFGTTVMNMKIQL